MIMEYGEEKYIVQTVKGYVVDYHVNQIVKVEDALEMWKELQSKKM